MWGGGEGVHERFLSKRVSEKIQPTAGCVLLEFEFAMRSLQYAISMLRDDTRDLAYRLSRPMAELVARSRC